MAQLGEGQKPLAIYRDRRAPKRWGLNQWGGDLHGRGIVAGPCYLMLNSVERSESRSLRLTKVATPNAKAEPVLLQIQYSMLFDPKVADAVVGYEVRADAAIDEQGKALTPQKHWVMPVFPSQEQVSGAMVVEVPQAPNKKIRSLQGTIRLAVVTETQPWEIDLRENPTAQKTFDIAGAQKTLSFIDTSELNGLLQITFGIKGGPAPAERWFGNGKLGAIVLPLSDPNILQRSMRFLDAQGDEIYMTGSSTDNVRTADNRLIEGANLKFNRLNPDDIEHKPVKIIFNVPTEWREVDVPFEFKDLPLPCHALQVLAARDTA